MPIRVPTLSTLLFLLAMAAGIILPPAFPAIGGPAAPAEDDDPGPGLLLFRNGDALHGTLSGLDTGRVLWARADAPEPLALRTPNIAEIRLAEHMAASPSNIAPTAIVRLTNDDEIPGRVRGLDAGVLTIETPYAGVLRIPRALLASLAPQTRSRRAVFSGPTGMEGWVVGQRQNQKPWVFRRGALYSLAQSTLGRDVSLPDRADIRFDMEWRGYPSFLFAFYSANLQNYHNNCYALHISGTSVFLQRFADRGGGRPFEGVNIPRLTRINRARFRILVDRPQGQVLLFLDDVLAKQWSDRDAPTGGGGGIIFYPQNQNLMKLSRIEILDWDGRLPEGAREDVEESADEDVAWLLNGDKVTGKLETIVDSALSFRASYATLSIPSDRVISVAFASSGLERPRLYGTDVRVHLRGRGRLTFRLQAMRDDRLTGIGPGFGPIAVPLSAIATIECNLYYDPLLDDPFPVEF